MPRQRRGSAVGAARAPLADQNAASLQAAVSQVYVHTVSSCSQAWTVGVGITLLSAISTSFVYLSFYYQGTAFFEVSLPRADMRWIIIMCGLASLVDGTVLWFWYLLWRASSLRSQLLMRFLATHHTPAFVDLSDIDLSSFCKMPKGVDRKKPLLWTSQTEALWQELRVESDGDSVRAQILAGPSGIGKSHVALLLALRCYAEGMPVLYVRDAGELFEECVGFMWPLRWSLEDKLLRYFAISNVDKAPLSLFYRLLAQIYPDGVSLLHVLDAGKAVVVIDEHGHAYNKLVKRDFDPGVYFRLLMPNSYIDGRYVRCVLAGSNQAQFEGELNGTYTPCLRFVLPFTEIEATQYLSKLLHVNPTHDVRSHYARLTSFVPREMEALAANGDGYVAIRRGAMIANLRRVVDAMDRGSTRYDGMVNALELFFHASSMAFGSESYSFLDLGYIFRRGGYGTAIAAVPLCYPATLALLDLWRSVRKAAGPRLTEVIARGDGTGFENLVWEVLLARGFVDNSTITCKKLWANGASEQLALRFSSYFVSTRAPGMQDVINSELIRMLDECIKLKENRLYRCPAGCADVDFFILHSRGTYTAIQTSLSSLTAHCKSDSSRVILGIPARFGIAASKLARYVYITTTPESHQVLAKNTALSHVRIVDAAPWIGA